MIQKESVLNPLDNSGILKVKVFHIYRGGKGKIGYVGNFFKVSAREVKPESTFKKKSKHRSILIKSVYKNIKKDGSYVSFGKNGLILLKKRLTPKGSLIRGSISWLIRRKKFLSSFSGVI